MDMSGIQDLDQYGGQRPPVVTFELWTLNPEPISLGFIISDLEPVSTVNLCIL